MSEQHAPKRHYCFVMAVEDASLESSSVARNGASAVQRPPSARRILLFGSLFSVLFYGLVFISAAYLRHVSIDAAMSFWSNDFPRPMPVSAYPTPLGNHFFGDFLIPFRLAQQPSPYLAEGFVPFGYLPMSAVVLGPLTLLDYWWAFLAFMVVSISILMVAVWRSFPRQDKISPALMVAFILLSGPFVNALDRGNIGLLMVSIMCLGVFAEVSGKRLLSGICFGLAGAMKLYPAFLGAVFLNRGRVKTGVVMAITAVSCVVVPLLVYSGGWKENLFAMKNQFAGSSNFLHAERIHAFNNSFFALFHAMEMTQFPVIHGVGRMLVAHYYLVMLVVALLALSVALHPRVPSLSKYVSCCVTMVFLPNIVGSYVLLIMLVPLLLGLATVSRTGEALSRTTILQLHLLVLMLVPKGLPFPNPLAEWSQVESTFSSVLNPFLGFFLLMVSLVELVRVLISERFGIERLRSDISLLGPGADLH